MPFSPELLEKFPSLPGVYIMKDISDRVLYVGKAIHLKKRLKQYFLEQDDRPLVPYLIKEIETIETIIVNNEKEALLLENNLIKKYQPRYNILLKDDKTFISLVLTKHKWPMLKLLRYKGSPPPGTHFGPYTNAKAARETLDLILRLSPLRQCSDMELISRTRPCILYDIKRCCAPCVNKCTQDEYQDHIHRAKMLLKGQNKEVLSELKQKMKHSAEKLEFEKAQTYLELIHKIEHVTQVQHVDNAFSADCDVLALYREGTHIMIVKLIYRERKLIGSEHFSFSNIISDDHEVLQSFILQHYQSDNLPSEIFLSIPIDQKELSEEILSEKTSKKIKIIIPQKGDKKRLIEIAFKNAESLFKREVDLHSLEEKRLLDLQETLQLTRFPKKIECFDTSNLSGDEPVACMVAFTNGKKDTSKMRLFKIRNLKKSDDYGAIKEVLLRHYQKQNEKHSLCDLIVIDGGRGHLNLALDVLNSLNIAFVDVISVAKHGSRHDKGLTEEKVYVPHQKEPILIHPTSPLMFLLQNIRDEAHRVAISFQRKRRKITTSSLDQIEGIGPIKKKALLKTFKSIKNLKSATKEDLEKVKELNKTDIEKILLFISKQE